MDTPLAGKGLFFDSFLPDRDAVFAEKWPRLLVNGPSLCFYIVWKLQHDIIQTRSVSPEQTLKVTRGDPPGKQHTKIPK